MRKIIAILTLFAISVFANEHAGHASVGFADTDFIPRAINFVIFVAILWWLLADKIKTFYANRSNSIADSFAQVQTKLQESKRAKEALKKEVEEAHKKAEEIIKSAQKEAELLKTKVLDDAKKDIEALSKQFEDQKAYEESKMKKTVVESYLANLTQDVHLSSEEVANIVTKKVG